jgi:uncharacterized protein
VIRRITIAKIAIIVGVIFALYLVPTFLFVGLADQLLLFPNTRPLNVHGAARKTLPFGKGELEIWTARSRLAQSQGRSDVYVLRFYGNADRADAWVAAEAEAWNERAVEVWGVNYPGFGGSTGPARLNLIAPAALTAFDELQHTAGERPIVLFGASIGTAPALYIAAHRPVAGLILHNPPPLRQMILRQFGWWNLWILAGPVAQQIPRELDSITNSKAIHAPAIFLLAEEDEIVASRFQQLVVDAYPGEKRVIALRGAHHNSPIEGVGLADLYKALDLLLPRSKN